ncbi:MAG TPA: pentapeptide repeat-containing protein [Kofleriaceae bacterium]
MIVITGTPRSLFEMEFVAGMFACETCGDWHPVDWRTGGTHADWLVHAACPRCASERAYAFRSEIDLIDVEVADLELGGPEPSQILEPFELVREIDRLVPTIASAPELLDRDAWEANHLVVDRVRTALAELEKFLVGDVIPAESHRSAAAHIDRAMRVERYQRAWIHDERAHWEANAKRIALDAPRILAANRQKPPFGTLDAEALAAHRVWLESNGARGRRLVVVTAYAAARVMRGGELTGSRLEQLNLADADLVGTELGRAELFEVDLARARVETATLTGALLVRCTFTGAMAENASFSSAVAKHCGFGGAKLATSQWTKARVEHCVFTDADIADAELGLAHFIDCDLRNASFAGAVLAGAVFERCDLRGVNLSGADLRGTSFVHCAFSTAFGQPIATAGWLVTAADFSDRADASDLGDADDLYTELTSS